MVSKDRNSRYSFSAMQSSVRELIGFVGDDPNREGLRETPARVAKAWREWCCGYEQNPSEILKTFEDGAPGAEGIKAGEMVIVHNIPVHSKCEHHLADIVGVAHVAYIPDGKIVGLSKLARLTDCYARRLQVQERMTTQIADALMEHLRPLGAAVLVQAAHHCMATRGVKVHGAMTTTNALRGVFMDSQVRAEFLTLCNMAKDR